MAYAEDRAASVRAYSGGEQSIHETKMFGVLGVKSVLGALSDAMASGERVEIRGFGAFTLRYRDRSCANGDLALRASLYRSRLVHSYEDENAAAVIAMGYAEDLAASVRTFLGSASSVHETKMFGGIGFMLNGNLVAGASSRGLLVRVGKDRQAKALAWPASRVMEMRDRLMEGYVYLGPPGTSADAVKACLDLARAHVETLPPKTSKSASSKATKAASRKR